MISLIRLSIYFSALTLMSACVDKDKEAAITGKPVMLAEAMVSKFCAGDLTVSKALTESCMSEHAKFGDKFQEGANCSELKKAMSLISDMRKVKSGSCSPSIRF